MQINQGKKKFKMEMFILCLLLSLIKIAFMPIRSVFLVNHSLDIKIGILCLMALYFFIKVQKIKFSCEFFYYICALSFLSFKSGFYNLLFVMIIHIFSFEIHIKDMLRCLFFAETFGVAVFFLLKWTGFVEGYLYTTVEGRVRNTLGFSNVNFTAIFFVSWLILGLMNKRMKFVYVLVSSVLVIVITMITDTKTTAVFFCLFLIIYYFSRKVLKRKHSVLWKRRFKFLVDCSFFMIFILPFFSKYIYRIVPWLDIIFSGRFLLNAQFVQAYGKMGVIFGSKYGLGSSDTFFLNFVFLFGFPFALWTVCVVIRGVNRMIDIGDYSSFSFALSMWIANFAESYLLRLDCMILFLFWEITFLYAFKWSKCNEHSVMEKMDHRIPFVGGQTVC